MKKLVGTKKSLSMTMIMSMTIHKSNMALPKFNGNEDKSAKKTTTNEPLKFTKSGVGLAKRSSNIPCVVRNKSREYLAKRRNVVDFRAILWTPTDEVSARESRVAAAKINIDFSFFVGVAVAVYVDDL